MDFEFDDNTAQSSSSVASTTATTTSRRRRRGIHDNNPTTNKQPASMLRQQQRPKKAMTSTAPPPPSSSQESTNSSTTSTSRSLLRRRRGRRGVTFTSSSSNAHGDMAVPSSASQDSLTTKWSHDEDLNDNQHNDKDNDDDDDDDDDSSDDNAMVVVSVKGAGASAEAVQTAGTYQMLYDECSYLCSTMMGHTSRKNTTPTQALDAALDLALLLSSPKTRYTLFAPSSSKISTTTTTQQQREHENDDGMAASHNGDASTTVSSSSSSTTSSTTATATATVDASSSSKLLNAILDVLSKTGQAAIKSKQQQPFQSNNNSNAIITTKHSKSILRTSSPPRSPTRGLSGSGPSRTKSARRKQQQQQAATTLDTTPLSFSSSSSSMMMMMPPPPPVVAASSATSSCGWMTPELEQVLACLIYFLSWDCTLSPTQSAATMGVLRRGGTKQQLFSKQQLARSWRWTWLHHGTALQGILQLCSFSTKKSLATTTTKNRDPSQDDDEEQEDSSSMPGSNASSPSRKSLATTTTSPPRKRKLHWDPELSNSPSGDSRCSSSISVLSDNDHQHHHHGGILHHHSTTKKEKTGDPTAAGRRRKRQRKQLGLPSVPEHQDDLDWASAASSVASSAVGCLSPGRIVPAPPPAANSGTTNLSFTSTSSVSGQHNDDDDDDDDDNVNTSISKMEKKRKQQSAAGSCGACNSPDRSVASTSSESSLLVSSRMAQKLAQLRSKVTIQSTSAIVASSSRDDHSTMLDHDPWVTMVCLESLNRIIQGKEEENNNNNHHDEGGKIQPSCLEEQDSDEDQEEDDDDHEEAQNPLLQSNTLLGKSGVIPLLAKDLSRSLSAICQLSSSSSAVDDVDQGNSACHNSCSSCWTYWHDRIRLVASFIDGACLFNKSNRRGFCEDDTLSFQERNDGLIHHILMWLNIYYQMRQKQKQLSEQENNNDGNPCHSEILLIALRTLTSLTHENELAAKQMVMYNNLGLSGKGLGLTLSSSSQDDDDDADDSSASCRGIEILALLVYQLETNHEGKIKNITTTSSMDPSMTNDQDLHRYDSTIFCLNTLANIIEAADARRILAEIAVPSSSSSSRKRKEKTLWIQWLCTWLVDQTATFRDAILGFGSNQASSKQELQKNEEDPLLAAGNGCVLLAFLMIEPEEIAEEPESTNSIRKLIIEQMPKRKDGSSTGVTMIVNTLKAFCNFYHYSLGDLSVAIITPVRKLIKELEAM